MHITLNKYTDSLWRRREDGVGICVSVRVCMWGEYSHMGRYASLCVHVCVFVYESHILSPALPFSLPDSLNGGRKDHVSLNAEPDWGMSTTPQLPSGVTL